MSAQKMNRFPSHDVTTARRHRHCRIIRFAMSHGIRTIFRFRAWVCRTSCLLNCIEKLYKLSCRIKGSSFSTLSSTTSSNQSGIKLNIQLQINSNLISFNFETRRPLVVCAVVVQRSFHLVPMASTLPLAGKCVGSLLSCRHYSRLGFCRPTWKAIFPRTLRHIQVHTKKIPRHMLLSGNQHSHYLGTSGHSFPSSFQINDRNFSLLKPLRCCWGGGGPLI